MTGGDTRALLEVRGLEKRFGPVRAVDGVSFDLVRGRALGLVGESGSGKSTVARCLVGLERPDAGSVKLDGAEITGLSRRGWRPHRRRVQMIFQDPGGSLDPRRTVGASVAEPLAIHGLPRSRVRELLESVGLSRAHAARYPHELSGGQRQRVAIARALALSPDVLVCDEPVSALDVSVQAQIVNLLRELQQRTRMAILFIGHDLAVVRHVCQDVAVMYLGRIVETAPREALFGDPRHPYTRALLSAVPVPDPGRERARARIVLAGDPPSPLAPPPGCAFHPRCPEREKVPGDRCRTEIPALSRPRGVNGTEEIRTTACHLHDPRPEPPLKERDPWPTESRRKPTAAP